MTELTEDRIKQIRHIPSKSKYQWDILIECYDLKEADSFRQQILQALSLEKRVREIDLDLIISLIRTHTKNISHIELDTLLSKVKQLQQLLGDKA